MTKGVVDSLEVIEVDHDHDITGAQPAQSPPKHAPIGQTGEAVDRRIVGKAPRLGADFDGPADVEQEGR